VIFIVTTNRHRYTHEELQSEQPFALRVISYLVIRKLQLDGPATFVFTDLDRLAPDLVGTMAKTFRDMRDDGHRMLNDPVRALGRFGLLRALNRAGINDFDCYRADELSTPRRWPVFLRAEGNHGQPLSGLLGDERELGAALDQAREAGTPYKELLIIEYCAEPLRPGLFRKLSVFRLGERLIGFPSVHDNQWIVKYGKGGLADDALYEEDQGFVTDSPFLSLMAQVFDIAGVDYGRVDFGIVGGRPQIYEINTNPDIKLSPRQSKNARRNQTIALFRENFLAAMMAIDIVGAGAADAGSKDRASQAG
jgi:hypothetical protein